MVRIVFDVDNVLADTISCWCIKATKYLGTPVSKNQIKHHKIVGSVNMAPREVYALLDEVWSEWSILPTTEEGIPDLFNELKNSGHNIAIATCRPIRSANLVLKWLRKNGIPFDSYHPLGPYKSKSELNCDALIDDAPDQINQIIDNGKNGFLYLQPWNISSSVHKAVKIQTLPEITKYFE